MTRVLLPVLLRAHAITACGEADTVPATAEETAGIPADIATATEVRLTDDGIVPDTVRMAVGDIVRLVVVNETDGPGEDGSATFVVPPDHAGVWQMACLLEDHARQGFRGVVLVEAAAGR